MSKLDNMTKAELIAMLQEKEGVVEKQEAKLKEFVEMKSGWLVIAPNVAYDGTTLGIKFTNGVAFVPRTRDFSDVVPPKDKRGTLEKQFGHIKEHVERERMISDALARQDRSSAVILMEMVQADYGYKVVQIDESNWDRVEEQAIGRAASRRQYEEELASEQAKQLVRPHYMGS